mmetsp:Transcript_720/g.1227  ORF Transcript_720/g.1227 Transcript_720/m.1227 type:complete len:591 (-) Transcript_720:46-1818(-)
MAPPPGGPPPPPGAGGGGPPPPPPTNLAGKMKKPKAGLKAVLKVEDKKLTKTDGPVFRKDEFDKQAKDMKLTKEQLQGFLAQYEGAKSEGAVLGSFKSLKALKSFVEEKMAQNDPKDEEKNVVLLAFDFDYTLKVPSMQVRGGEESVAFLEWAKEQGHETIVITAQEPTKMNVRNFVSEMRHLKLDHVMDCQVWDRKELNEYLLKLGPNSGLTDEQLTAKLATLICLHTERFPEDLPRLMFGPTLFSPDNDNFPPYCFQKRKSFVEYRMWQEREEGQRIDEELSAPLYIYADLNGDARLCPVDCWQEFDKRNKQKHYASDTPDRAFLRANSVEDKENGGGNPTGGWWDGNWNGRWWEERSWQPGGKKPERVHKLKEDFFEYDNCRRDVPVFEAMTGEELKKVVGDLLAEAGTPHEHAMDVVEDTVLEHDVSIHRDEATDVVKICQKGRLMASRYNKPEAIQLFRSQIKGKKICGIIFIDDSAANAFNVYGSFCKQETEQKEKGESNPVTGLSIWWPPPPSVNKDMSLPLHTQCMKSLHNNFLENRSMMRESFGVVEEEEEEKPEEKKEEEKKEEEGKEKEKAGEESKKTA